MAVLFFAAGLGLYGYLRHVLVSSFDEALLEKARLFASTTEEMDNGRLESEFIESNLPEYRSQKKAEYFQVWGENGQTVLRSPSLGTRDLLSTPPENELPHLGNVRLPDGRAGRVVTIRYVPQPGDEDEPRATSQERSPLTLALASSQEVLLKTLRRILKGMSIAGIALILCVMPAVWNSVRKGLRPLQHISDRHA